MLVCVCVLCWLYLDSFTFDRSNSVMLISYYAWAWDHMAGFRWMKILHLTHCALITTTNNKLNLLLRPAGCIFFCKCCSLFWHISWKCCSLFSHIYRKFCSLLHISRKFCSLSLQLCANFAVFCSFLANVAIFFRFCVHNLQTFAVFSSILLFFAAFFSANFYRFLHLSAIFAPIKIVVLTGTLDR